MSPEPRPPAEPNAPAEPHPPAEPHRSTSRYVKWARTPRSTGAQVAGLLPVGVGIVVLLPLLFIIGGPWLDRLIGVRFPEMGALNYVLGGLLVVSGLACGLSAVILQLTRGRGTPLPMMPTQELLTSGPYRYSRNPMTLGTVAAYVGVGVIAETISGIVLALCFAALLLVYLKRKEEGELAERFGEAYVAYKRDVPFFIPRWPKRG